MRRIAALVAALLIVIVASVPARAASGWTEPTIVWDARYSQPSMVVDAHGHAHIAARGNDGIWYITDKTGHWTRTRLTRDEVGDPYGGTTTSTPRIALDPWDGSLTVVYVESTCCVGFSGLNYVTNRHADASGAWSKPEQIPSGPQADSPSVVVRHGIISVAVVMSESRRGVAFITDASGPWTSQDIPVARGRSAAEPSLALDAQRRPVIAYLTHRNDRSGWARLHLARGSSTTGGFTSERVATISGEHSPSLVLDAHGRPRIGFLAYDGVHLATWTAAGWSVDRVRAMDVVDDESGMLVLRLVDGRPFILVAGVDTARGVWALARSGGSWHETQLDPHRPLGVALAVKGGRAHVAYQLGQRVWYTRER